MPAPYTLVLLRHGSSEWNEKGLFTGWVDVRLSETGVQEAIHAGELLRDSGMRAQWLSRGSFALGAAGVVTTGLIYMLSGKDEGKPSQVRPTASVLHGGGMVGVAGTLP